MLRVENRHHLRDDGVLLPTVEQVVECVAPGVKRESIGRGPESLRTLPGWIVFCDPEARGLAINIEGMIPSKTDLRRKLRAVQNARRIIEWFGGSDDFSLRLGDRAECPPEWTVYRVGLGGGVVLCALSLPAPVLSAPVHSTSAPWGQRKFAVPLRGYLDWGSLLSVGDSKVISTLRVECLEQRLTGAIVVSEGGFMSIQGDDVSTLKATAVQEHQTRSAPALVRLDLGEIELSLHELSALRAGTAIELSSETPLQCFMRVGATTLAQGELSLDGQNIVLTIKEMMSY